MDEVEYREKLIKQVHAGQKLSKEERLWLITNPIYNTKFGAPVLNVDILRLKPNCTYNVFVTLLTNNSGEIIFPAFGVPDKNGRIIVRNNLYRKGELCPYKDAYMVAFETLCDNKPSDEFSFKSTTGILSITIHCRFFDNHGLLTGKSSMSGDSRFAMRKKYVSDDEIVYFCTSPLNDNFNDYSFSVRFAKSE